MEGYLSYRKQNAKKAVISVASYCRAQRQIEKSIDQLVLRRHVLQQVWPDLGEKMPSLGLPEQYAGDDRVLCIAIANIMEFTGYVRDGIVVTDDWRFFRFFDEPRIKKGIVGEETLTDVQPIQASEEPIRPN